MEKKFNSGRFNPYLPLDTYIPDGEPKVFDGRVYLYGSKDEWGGEYCCHKYHVYSAPLTDLTEWTDHGPALASTDEYLQEGIADGVDWSDGLLWAPDIAKKGDTYYLYFCLSDGSEGVAESKKPYGPFENAKRITMGGMPIEGIDPSVLQEGDDYYYTWGQGHCHMAKLNEDMCTLDPETFVEALISSENGMQGFHEGSSLRKIGDHYCIVYASEYTENYPNRGGSPKRLDYAISDCVTGPYVRGGCIVDNTGIDPSSWNNHGSIIKLGDQWYVFYHGSSNNTKYTRRCRVERIEVNEETGQIRQVEMTSSGFAESLDPCVKVEAAYGYRVEGGAYFTQRQNRFPLINVKNESSVSWRWFDFGEKAGGWNLKLEAEILRDCRMEIWMNGEKKAEICAQADAAFEGAVPEIAVPESAALQTLSVQLEGLAGMMDMKIAFAGEMGGNLAELYSVVFEK